jgi:uncharacterized protein
VRLSRFAVVYRNVAPGEHALYDVLSDRYVGVDDAALAAVDRWRDAAPAEAEREAAGALRDLGLVVEGDAADDARLEAAYRNARRGDGRVYVTLLPTLACDLACTYCIQKDTPAAGHMTAATEDAAVAFALARVDASRLERLTVHYIGGEPLVRKDLVLRTAARLSAAMRARGGRFDWELTTNGVGLETELVRALLAHGPGWIKVTLDGDRATHDSARVRRDGRGTFDDVLANLLEVARACPEVGLRVGGNFRPGQRASYERLLDRLEAASLAGRLQSVRFKPVVDAAPCGACGAGPAGADELVQLGRSAARRGLAPGGDRFGVDAAGACELHWDEAWTVDPRGLLYRCYAVAGRAELAVGDVRTGATRSDPLVAEPPWTSDARCRACPFVPACYGGCLGGAYLVSGRTGHVLCRRDHLEASFEEAVTRRYLEEFHPQSHQTRAA